LLLTFLIAIPIYYYHKNKHLLKFNKLHIHFFGIVSVWMLLHVFWGILCILLSILGNLLLSQLLLCISYMLHLCIIKNHKVIKFFLGYLILVDYFQTKINNRYYIKYLQLC
jgi:hypothetical protein